MCVPYCESFFYVEDDDWNTVIIECNSLSAKWEQLSAFLGLSKKLIESIKKNHPNDDTGCWNDALSHWIGQNYNAKKFGVPSWKRLLEAIALVDKLVFKKLAREHEGEIFPILVKTFPRKYSLWGYFSGNSPY